MEDVDGENPEQGCLGRAVGQRGVCLKPVRNAQMKGLPATNGRGKQLHRSREDIRYGTLAVVPIVEIDGYVERNGFGPSEHPNGPLDRVMVPDPDLRPQGRGVDCGVVPVSGDEHEGGEHKWILFFFGRENAESEDGCEELVGETVDRGGTLRSDGLFESGFDFFAFCTEIRHFGLEEEESLPEVGDGEIRRGF